MKQFVQKSTSKLWQKHKDARSLKCCSSNLQSTILSEIFTQDMRYCLLSLLGCVAGEVRWSQSEIECRTHQTSSGLSARLHRQSVRPSGVTHHTTCLSEKDWPHQFNLKGPDLLLTEISGRILLEVLPQKVIDRKTKRLEWGLYIVLG